MRNMVSINKAKTLMLGKFAGLSVLAGLAMSFATPLMANPAMCGLPNVKATFQQAIIGFTQNTDGSYVFTPAPSGAPIMLGSYVEVKTDKGTFMPATIRAISEKNSKLMVKGFLDPHLSSDAATITIAGVSAVACSGTCNLSTSTATMVKPISGFTQNTDGTFTFTSAPDGAVIKPGSWIEVTTSDGKNLPATIAAPINTQNKSTMGYVEALDKTQATKVTISMTSAQAAGSW